MAPHTRYIAAYYDREFKRRFYRRVDLSDLSETECWRWLGAIIKGTGYGTIGYDEGYIYAHRFMHMVTTGLYPLGLDIHHTCENKWCVSPYHLQALTREQHMSIRHYGASN